MQNPAESRISIAAFDAITARALPMAQALGLRVERMAAGRVTARLPHAALNLRPGGTVAGPAMMALADYAMYAVVLSMVGKARAGAVTVNLNINFLSRPEPGDILAEGRIVKLGKRLAFGEVALYSDGRADPVAHVTASYSIPPEK
ncbi:MAG: PaaI family thioesterase [Rhodospirillales bacterium]